jgi:hypothetical protein
LFALILAHAISIDLWMYRGSLLRIPAGLLLVGFLSSISSLNLPAAWAAQSRGTVTSLPMTFERNDGQVPRQYLFVSRHQGIQALFSAKGQDFVIPQASSSSLPFGGVRKDGNDPKQPDPSSEGPSSHLGHFRPS